MSTPATNSPLLVPPAQSRQLPAESLRIVPSSELLQGQVCVHIEHAGAVYTLRATRSGKLILTK